MDSHTYFGLCANHDWFFNYSDDNSVYNRGLRESQTLMKYLKMDVKYHAIYDAWRNHIHWGVEPKPDFKDFE